MSGEGLLSNRNTVTTRMRRGTITCPICNHDAGIRDSDQETELVKSLWIMCLNVDCGLTWKAQISFVYVISPSAIERDDVILPPPPPGYVRRIFPAGPPTPRPDPNQFDMFAEDSGAAPCSAAA